MEEETEKEDLKGYLGIVPREEFVEDVESLSIKYPIVDWKTCVLTENFIYYQIFRGYGSSENISSSEDKKIYTNGVSTASTYLVLPELVNTARRMINTADGQSC
ncbi:hypothetical protein Tco_0586915 [Tanacetum coccineum]